MNILIIGTDYVGLVTGACLAEMGFHVTCLDIDSEKIEKLKKGIIPIYEPGLEEIIEKNLKAQRIQFTTQYKESVENAEIIFLCVNTPVSTNGSADLTALRKAVTSVGQYLNRYTVIVNKSTAPVGTVDKIKEMLNSVLEERKVDVQFDVVSNPEFLKEGSAVFDFMKPDRIVIGCTSDRAKNIMKTIYKPFMLSCDRIYFMDPKSAELTKYAANAMLAIRISFMNWLSRLSEITGGDITEVRKGVGSDKRIGFAFLWAGIGFGGSCFPKDLKALKAMGENAGLDTTILDAIDTINESQKEHLFHKIEEYYKEDLSSKTMGILGLSFKPDTDDMREAPSIVLIEKLLKAGVKLRLFDPIAMDNAKKLISNDNITWCENELELAKDCHAIILATEWKQFRQLDLEKLLQVMQGSAFFDGRNQYTPEEISSKGFDYISIGRPSAFATLSSLQSLEKELDEFLPVSTHELI